MFNNETTNEEAVVKIRFSPQFFEEIIEFDVELNSIDWDKNRIGKDVIVNWKFYDNFDPKGKFYTDSNSLAMVERNVNLHEDYVYEDKYSNISANYYPVTSAIAMRDLSSPNATTQVTIMNDRAQGGTADVNHKANIELMQHRRLSDDDNKGVDEYLNETDKNGKGI